MKQIFHKIMAGFMALVVLLSTMSFTVNMHFCGDKLVDTTLFSEADFCNMEMCDMDIIDNTIHKECTVSSYDCCDDQQITFLGRNDIKITLENFTFEQQVFIVSFVYSYVQLFDYNIKKNVPYKNYSSPLFVKNIYKLDEVYLI